MGRNPSKRDAWPAWGDVRFVLVRSPGRLRPRRGLVLDWSFDRSRPRARRWRAFVVYIDDVALQQGPRLEWLEVDDLVPVEVDPNLAAPTPHAPPLRPSSVPQGDSPSGPWSGRRGER